MCWRMNEMILSWDGSFLLKLVSKLNEYPAWSYLIAYVLIVKRIIFFLLLNKMAKSRRAMSCSPQLVPSFLCYCVSGSKDQNIISWARCKIFPKLMGWNNVACFGFFWFFIQKGLFLIMLLLACNTDRQPSSGERKRRIAQKYFILLHTSGMLYFERSKENWAWLYTVQFKSPYNTNITKNN